MTSKNNHSLAQQALQHKVAPSESAWLKLDSKLEKSRNRRKVSVYRLVSIAAVMVAVLSVITVFVINGNHAPQAAIQNNTYAEVFDMEELKTTGDVGIYEINKLRSLKSAYTRLGTKQNL
jgi:hypothetical protein